MSLCLCMLRDGEYSSTLRSAGSTLPSAGSMYANLGYMSTSLHVLRAHKIIRFGEILCTRKTCKHISFVVIFYVCMHRCTKETHFTWIFAKRDTHPKKQTSQRYTHGQKKGKKLKCVNAYMYTRSKKSLSQ